MGATTLHHIPDTDHMLRVFHDLPKPGGWLAIADLDREDGSFHGPEVDVHYGFDRGALATKAKAAGFTAPTFDTVLSIDKGTGDARRSYPVFLMTCRRLLRRAVNVGECRIHPAAIQRFETWGAVVTPMY